MDKSLVDSNSRESILISIKPRFAVKIFSGEKTVELRKCAPKIKKDDYVMIYVTAPVKELWGICRVKEIIKDDTDKLWNLVHGKAGITEKEYQNYYGTCKKGVGIVLKNISCTLKPISLHKLKSAWPKFSPPQTYKYFSRDEVQNLYNTTF